MREEAMARGLGARTLELDSRSAPLRAFWATEDPRAVALRANKLTMVIQNDGDEMLAATTALHLTHCEPVAPPPYYVPSTSYKLNTEWVQVSFNMPSIFRAAAAQARSPQLPSAAQDRPPPGALATAGYLKLAGTCPIVMPPQCLGPLLLPLSLPLPWHEYSCTSGS